MPQLLDLSEEGLLKAIKQSYFNMLSLFLEQEKVESDQVRCFLKWGFQLKLNPEDIRIHGREFNLPKFEAPNNKIDQLESLFHLVYIIYLDRVIDDDELNLASLYAEKLGLKKELVGDLFRSIATVSYDISSPMDVRKEVLDFMKINNP